jgi:metal-responsive CopG/Arc/MetJ family transcriptional regulator
MKLKTSITLSEDIVRTLENQANRGESRSEQIERLLRERLSQMEREKREAKDVELINKNAEELNEEATDVLEYQGEV